MQKCGQASADCVTSNKYYSATFNIQHPVLFKANEALTMITSL